MNSTSRYIIIGITIILLGFTVWYLSWLIAYILISVVMSFIGRPLVEYASKIKVGKFRIPKSLSSIITLILIWTFILMFFRIFVPLVANQAEELASIDVQEVAANLEAPLDKIEKFAEKYHLTPNGQTVQDYATEKAISILNIDFISDIFGSIANTLGNLFIAFFSISFMTFFFLKEESLYLNAVLLLAPARYEKSIRHVMRSVKKLLSRYFIGIMIQVTCIIILVTTGLTIVGAGFDHALVIGLTAGIMNVVPYIGPIVGTIIGLLIGAATHLYLPFHGGLAPLLIYMLIVFLIVQTIDNVVFQPLIYSSSVNAHPMEIFLVIMIAGSLAGVGGMILAIPTYTVLRVIAKEFFNKLRLVKKLTEKI